ncbi:MAG: phosphotransferase [Polyangiaceae bacterium]|nr:phosphotransferase [Polyangiaceae bacterium]
MSFAVPSGYRLVAYLGAGTVLDVARVVEQGARGELVCKRVAPRPGASVPALRALRRERAVLERVVHRALPSLRAAGEDDHGPYLVETAVPGLSLAALVEGFATQAGEGAACDGAPIPARLLAAVARASFTALAELHALADGEGPLGFVHGDLAPDHVLVTPSAEVGFVDLGQARLRGLGVELFDPDPQAERGTLPYVAPELARGSGPPGQGSDVYALAATLAFAALGREPVATGEAAAQLAELAEQGVAWPAVAQALAGLGLEGLAGGLRRALAFEPAGRPSAAAVAAALASSTATTRR